jgi:lipopolysaccharide export system protein LptA
VRLTIERLRTLVLVAGALLVVALVAFLAIGHWKSKFNLREVPKKLGIDIQQEANGVTYTQSHGGHTIFKIHASKVVQLKVGGRALLHDVHIELYGQDGRTDRITGNEFEYDQKTGVATAAGPVEITIMRPATAAPGKQADGAKNHPTPLTSMEQKASSGDIDVKTSGLTFDQKSGTATTTQHVEFSTLQGHGDSMGATFDSDNGHLVLDRAVELNVRRGPENVLIHAQHAEFNREDLLCHLQVADAHYRNGEATAVEAAILFRDDGSAVRLDAHNGFTMTSATGAHIAAPTATLDFNEKSQPRHGHLEGGVTMDSTRDGRQVHGASPTAELEFTADGDLHHAHLERGVWFESNQDATGPVHVRRDWRSPVADVAFRPAANNQVEIDTVHGTGGVVITGETQRAGGPAVPSLMSADDVTGNFGPQQELAQMVGVGHANLDETTAKGAHQATSGDRIDVHFAPRAGDSVPANNTAKSAQESQTAQIESATVDGNVVLVQQQPAPAGPPPPPALRATSGHAVYDGGTQLLHLTVNPRVEDGGLQLSADKIDVAQASGDAYAYGTVKATWLDNANANGKENGSAKPSPPAAGKPGALGGQGPSHVIANEAELQKATGEATFRGAARLWQGPNSVAAPVIVLNRTRETLDAHGSSPKDPVNMVLLSAGKQAPGPKSGKSNKTSTPSVIRVQSGDLHYSDAERKATLLAGVAGSVTAETGTATTTSKEAELTLLPPGNHAAADGGAAQVDRLTARDQVVIVSQGRRGTGEQLVYTSETGNYVLTGTSAALPKMTDPQRGVVTGESLIFNSRDDSVSIEGQGQKTVTDTRAPK